MKRLRFFLLLSLIAIFNMMADTPLTATDFYQVYMDVPEVKEASENKGKLTENAKAFLWDENNPQDQKLALVNALGWDFGDFVFGDYMDYVMDRIKKENPSWKDKQLNSTEFLSAVSPEQISLLSYMAALSNTLDMELPFSLAQQAFKNATPRQSFMLPIAFVVAEMESYNFETWPEIYKTFNDMVLNAPIKDMRPEAIDAIMDFINVYKVEEVTHIAIVDADKVKNEVIDMNETEPPFARGVVNQEVREQVIVKEPDNDEASIFVAIEQPAEFPGGIPALMNWLMENISYPDDAYKNGQEGRCVIQFVVNKDGSIDPASIVVGKSTGYYDLDMEAVRVVGRMPKWIPGKNDGTSVRSYFNLPVTFKIPDEDKAKLQDNTARGVVVQ